MAAITPPISIFHWLFKVLQIVERGARPSCKVGRPHPGKVTSQYLKSQLKACPEWDVCAAQGFARYLLREGCKNGAIDSREMPLQVLIECDVPPPQEDHTGMVTVYRACS